MTVDLKDDPKVIIHIFFLAKLYRYRKQNNSVGYTNISVIQVFLHLVSMIGMPASNKNFYITY